VSVATAVRWVLAVNTTGSVRPKPQGGDTRSHRIEAFAAVILAAVDARKDTTLAELAEMLRVEHGASFALSTVWRCLDRHAITFKKNRARGRAGPPRCGPAAQSLVRAAA
jgi:transposase